MTITCNKCKKEIADLNSKCPHCSEKKHSIIKYISAAMFVIIIIKSCGVQSDDKKNTQEKCKKSAECWSNEHRIDAEIRCESAIERLAKYEVNWSSGPVFKGYTLKNEGVIRYVGDAVQFQNGFGAMTNMTYVCDYNTEQNKVISIDVQEGRI